MTDTAMFSVGDRLLLISINEKLDKVIDQYKILELELRALKYRGSIRD
jgi:hypothetical protein